MNSGRRHGYTNEWLVAVNKQKKPFAEELFSTTFSQENVEKVLSELKASTEAKVAASPRLIEEDFTYSVQLTSFARPRVPIHLTRM